MEDEISMEASTGGGVLKSMKRWVTGDTFFISDFNNTSNVEKTIVFGANHPTKLIPILLSEHNNNLICQKGSFLCGSRNTQIEIYATQNLKTGFFGGEGFILQHLLGEGLVILKGGGALITKELREGEILRVSGGNLVAFEDTVQFDVEMVKGGAKNIVFGGEGLFLTTLTGPGRVYLQGMPFSKMVESIGRRVGGGRGGMMLPPIGGGGTGGNEETGDLEGEEMGEEIPTQTDEYDFGEGGSDLGSDGGGESGGGGGWFDALFGDDE
jgi:uncharacterized protein (AIM24 family)